MTEQENIKLFFKDEVVRRCVVIREIERIAKIPVRTLDLFINEKRNTFPDKHLSSVIKILKKIGYISIQEKEKIIQNILVEIPKDLSVKDFSDAFFEKIKKHTAFKKEEVELLQKKIFLSKINTSFL